MTALLLLAASEWQADYEALRAEVESLRATEDTWRTIQWRTCLLEAYAEARERERPLLIWALGGDPSGRC